MIYRSRVFSAACARLGDFFGTSEPRENWNAEHFKAETLLSYFFRFVAISPFVAAVPVVLLFFPALVFFSVLDAAISPPSQYFARGTWVCNKSLGYRENAIELWLSSPSLASSCSSFYPRENYTVNVVLPKYSEGSTSLCRQQSMLGAEPVAQNIGNMFFPDYFPCGNDYSAPDHFGGDDIIQNFIHASAAPIGFWLREGSLVAKEILLTGKVGGAS